MSEHQGSSKAARLADSIKDAFTGRSEDERDAGWERREAAATAEQDAGVPGRRHGDPDAPPLAGPGAGPGDVLLFRMQAGAGAKHLGVQAEIGPAPRNPSTSSNTIHSAR